MIYLQVFEGKIICCDHNCRGCSLCNCNTLEELVDLMRLVSIMHGYSG
jgi:hypothetical protein